MITKHHLPGCDGNLHTGTEMLTALRRMPAEGALPILNKKLPASPQILTTLAPSRLQYFGISGDEIGR